MIAVMLTPSHWPLRACMPDRQQLAFEMRVWPDGCDGKA